MEITEYIAWHVFESQEKLGGMKTTSVNGIPRIQAPLRRFGRSTETDKWRYKVLPDIIQQSWESLVKRLQHFDSELEQRCFEPDARQPEVHFLHPWAVFCRAEMYGQHHVTSHNANANGWKGCQKLCLGRKRMLKRGQ